jgi:hypothetical protein
MSDQLRHEYKKEAEKKLSLAQDSLLHNDAKELRKNSLAILEQYEKETMPKLAQLPSSNFTKSFDGKVTIQQHYNEYEKLAQQLIKEMEAVSYIDRLRQRDTIINELSERIATARLQTEQEITRRQKQNNTYTPPKTYIPMANPEYRQDHKLLPQGTLDQRLFTDNKHSNISYDKLFQLSQALFQEFKRLKQEGK